MSLSPLSRWRVCRTCSTSTSVTVPGMAELSTMGAMICFRCTVGGLERSDAVKVGQAQNQVQPLLVRVGSVQMYIWMVGQGQVRALITVDIA